MPGVENQPTKSSSVRSPASQWSRKASVSASQIRRWSASATGRTSSPSGSGASGIGSASGPDHHEAVSDSLVALRLEQRDRRRACVSSTHVLKACGSEPGPFAGGLARARLRPVEQGPPDARGGAARAEPSRRSRAGRRPRGRATRLGSCRRRACRRSRRRACRGPGRSTSLVLQLVPKVVDRRQVVVVVGEVRLDDEVDERRDVAVHVERPEAQAGDRRARPASRTSMSALVFVASSPTAPSRTSLPCASSTDLPIVFQRRRSAVAGERVDAPLQVPRLALELLPALEPARHRDRRRRSPRRRRSRARRRGRSPRTGTSTRGRRCRRTTARGRRRRPTARARASRACRGSARRPASGGAGGGSSCGGRGRRPRGSRGPPPARRRRAC